MSEAEPTDWNVVVAGAWNRAILTPAGITQRLFKLPPSAAVNIDVAMDLPGVFRVIHDGLIVDPTGGRLLVAPLVSGPVELEKAAKMACEAINSLPETPYSAAGVNFGFRLDAVLGPLRDVLASQVDVELSSAEFSILQRGFKRTLKFKDGQINIELVQDSEGHASLTFNFHRASREYKELLAWLSQTEAMVSETRRLSTILQITLGTEGERHE